LKQGLYEQAFRVVAKLPVWAKEEDAGADISNRDKPAKCFYHFLIEALVLAEGELASGVEPAASTKKYDWHRASFLHLNNPHDLVYGDHEVSNMFPKYAETYCRL
jgi:hypothetical protein